ncbi:MAG: SDR family NAD(P)-dependent oxidoreductase [Anaerolineae bacterium]|nr:SDR family NAD(P)-dependent oxidoreductase [Anaerolineae bacterium]
MEKGYFIITGTSRGIGEALAANLLEAGHSVLGVARSRSKRLEGERYTHLAFDLTETERVGAIVDKAVELASGQDHTMVCLVQNASATEPVGLIEQCTTEAIEHHLKIGLLSPAALTARFIEAFGEAPVRRKVVFVSSGAAFSPMPGLSIYCTAKAGLHMLAQTVGEEQKSKETEVEVVSIGPGMVDTDMQAVVRGKSDNDFPMGGLFQQAHTDGKLKDVDLVAARMAAMLWERQEQGAYVEVGEV